MVLEETFPWGYDTTIDHMKSIRNMFSDMIVHNNHCGTGVKDAKELEFDFNRAIDAIDFQKSFHRKNIFSVEVPFIIGDEAYFLKNVKGKDVLVKGKVSEIYFLDNWRSDDPSKMILCAVVKGVGRGIVGERVFASQEEALLKMKNKIFSENLKDTEKEKGES